MKRQRKPAELLEGGHPGRSQSEERGRRGQALEEAESSLPRTEKALALCLPGWSSAAIT